MKPRAHLQRKNKQKGSKEGRRKVSSIFKKREDFIYCDSPARDA